MQFYILTLDILGKTIKNDPDKWHISLYPQIIINKNSKVSDKDHATKSWFYNNWGPAEDHQLEW